MKYMNYILIALLALTIAASPAEAKKKKKRKHRASTSVEMPIQSSGPIRPDFMPDPICLSCDGAQARR